jgi:hypothetical protein
VIDRPPSDAPSPIALKGWQRAAGIAFACIALLGSATEFVVVLLGAGRADALWTLGTLLAVVIFGAMIAGSTWLLHRFVMAPPSA